MKIGMVLGSALLKESQKLFLTRGFLLVSRVVISLRLDRSGSVTERVSSKTEHTFQRDLSAKPIAARDGSMSDRGHHRAYSDILLSSSSKKLPKFEDTKIVLKSFGKICGFGVNTHKGCVRNYNEDRVSILLNAQQR